MQLSFCVICVVQHNQQNLFALTLNTFCGFFFVEGGSFIFRVSEDEVPQINMFERLPSARPLVFVNSCSNCFCLLLEDKLCRIYLWDPQANGLIRGKEICYGFRWGRGKFPLIKVEALNKLSIIKSFRHFKWASPKC